jgi:hypothetical protein
MHDTDATISTSLRSSSARVAECRSLSISSLIDCVFLDVRVRRRDVRLGLVVVVVGHEVANGVLGEERAKLVVELSGQRLVRGEYERRAG